MNKVIVPVIVAAVVIGIIGISFTSFEPSSVSKNQEPIKISVNAWPGYAHVFVAQEMGFFKDNGVNVELILRQDYTESQELYLNGDADGVFEVFTDTIVHNANGINTKAVYVADYSTTGDVIVGSVDSLSDLKDKMIGVESLNSFSHIFVLKALEEKAHLLESDVFFQVVPANEVLMYLENGDISAGHTWEPVKSQSLNQGYSLLATAEDVSGIITDVLAFDSQIVEDKPDDIDAIVKSMIQAQEFVELNRNQSVKIMADATGMSVDEMSSGLDGVYLLDLENNKSTMRDSQDPKSLFRTGTFIAEFFLERGQIDVIPNMNSIIDAQFLD